jgi:hypothetical protein
MVDQVSRLNSSLANRDSRFDLPALLAAPGVPDDLQSNPIAVSYQEAKKKRGRRTGEGDDAKKMWERIWRRGT